MSEPSPFAARISDFHHSEFGLIAYRLHGENCHPVRLLKDASNGKSTGARDFLISDGITLSLGNGIFLAVEGPAFTACRPLMVLSAANGFAAQRICWP